MGLQENCPHENVRQFLSVVRLFLFFEVFLEALITVDFPVLKSNEHSSSKSPYNADFP